MPCMEWEANDTLRSQKDHLWYDQCNLSQASIFTRNIEAHSGISFGDRYNSSTIRWVRLVVRGGSTHRRVRFLLISLLSFSSLFPLRLHFLERESSSFATTILFPMPASSTIVTLVFILAVRYFSVKWQNTTWSWSGESRVDRRDLASTYVLRPPTIALSQISG